MNRGNPRLQLLFRPTTSDPYAQNSFLETRVTLNGARRLLDEYGDAVGEGFAALPLLPQTPAFANHPADHIADPLRKGAQSVSLSCESVLRPHHLEYKANIDVLFLQTPDEP
jgi:hypothetical protein